MFFEQPFAGPAQFQSSAVDDQVKFARQSARGCKQAIHTRAGSGSDQAFALAKRQSKHGA